MHADTNNMELKKNGICSWPLERLKACFYRSLIFWHPAYPRGRCHPRTCRPPLVNIVLREVLKMVNITLEGWLLWWLRACSGG